MRSTFLLTVILLLVGALSCFLLQNRQPTGPALPDLVPGERAGAAPAQPGPEPAPHQA
jgi:hypothetical protein